MKKIFLSSFLFFLASSLYAALPSEEIGGINEAETGFLVVQSTTIVRGMIHLKPQPLALIHLLTPATANGWIVCCADCVTTPFCASTGTVAGAWASISNETSPCQ